jgi:hypothetical protein
VLFVYPETAIAENWLHDCLLGAVRRLHALARGGEAPPAWPGILPEPCRDRLVSRTGLRDKLEAYADAIAPLSAEEHDRVLSAIDNQNRIAELLSGGCDCHRIDELPNPIREPVAELFSFAFTLLTQLGSRDSQYKAIYENLRTKLCPFCGCEFFDAPTAPREAFDHYLTRSRYPFAGANLRNLAPIGPKCNSTYKRDIDIVRGDAGPRRAFDPYGVHSAAIKLDRSVPFEGTGGQTPRWEIDFEPASEEAETWDAVFSLRERYSRDVLDPNFASWLRWFSAWCKSAGQHPNDRDTLLAALDLYLEMLTAMGHDERAFLRSAMFSMLRNRCAGGDERLTLLMLDVVGEATAA